MSCGGFRDRPKEKAVRILTPRRQGAKKDAVLKSRAVLEARIEAVASVFEKALF